MSAFAYHVAYIDYRGRISAEGHETVIANERRTTFLRHYLDSLGQEGWELVGVQPLSPYAAYYIFKRPGQADAQRDAGTATEQAAESSPLGTL